MTTEDVGKRYTEIRKRAERRGLQAETTATGVRVSTGQKTKIVTTMEELEAFMGPRPDVDALAWRADCLRSRMDALTSSAKSDAVTAGEYRKLINAVDYAIQTLRSARNSEVASASRTLMQALAKLNQSDLPRGKPEEVDYMKRTAQDLLSKRKGDIGKKD